MTELENQPGGVQRTRRNFATAASLALGALVVASQKPASAQALGEGHHCFLRGTKIRTSSGYRNVEDLAVGDLLPTTFGGLRPIQGLESHRYERRNSAEAWPKRARPVRIMRSALADNIPSADLYLTATHALYVDGVLVPAGDLVNGTTITLDDADGLDVLEYFHIELESHDVIDAQGASCETLLEINATDASVADDIHKIPVAYVAGKPCAPMLSFRGGRNEVKSRLRSAVSPWVDRRQPLDVIRDRLEERGIVLARSTRPGSPANTSRRYS